MNKELINKFWDQFEWMMENKHRLVWIKHKDKKRYGNTWTRISDLFLHPGYVNDRVSHCVIDDEYAKVKMAYIDGDTVQYKLQSGVWEDPLNDLEFTSHISNYRIKLIPEWEKELKDQPIICYVTDTKETLRDKSKCRIRFIRDIIYKANPGDFRYIDSELVKWAYAEPININDLTESQKVPK